MKPRASKLDQYAATLADLDAQRKTLAEIGEWLAGEGCKVSPSRLSDYLEALRSERREQMLLAQITSGARQCQEIEQQFAKHPAPQLETLIKILRVFIMKLSTNATVEPAMLETVGVTLRSVLDAEKLSVKREELKRAEERETKAIRSDEEKALALVLEQAKAHPEVLELFKAAFAALKKSRAK